jgi:hypothetical protein
MLEGEKEALRKLDHDKLVEICEAIDKRRSEYWNEAAELRDAVRKFFTTRGSECVSAMTKLLNLASVEIKECANGDLIADLQAENATLKAKLEESEINKQHYFTRMRAAEDRIFNARHALETEG